MLLQPLLVGIIMAEHRPTTELPEPDAVVVVYDEQTGTAQHIHQEFTMPDAQGPSQADILNRAAAHARESSESRPGKALLLSREDWVTLHEARGPVKVDVSKRRLVSPQPK